MSAAPDTADITGMVWIPGGEFAMGSDRHYREEAPAHLTSVDGFWIDKTTATNGQFADFVEDTGYVTIAEIHPDPSLYPGAKPEALVPGALVFTMTDGPVDLGDYANWWKWVPGADWRHPTGPDSSLAGLDDHPVVHIAHPDAVAFCGWMNKALPSEAEWEFAARGGVDAAEFVWGEDDRQETEPVANTWQGGFPYENTELDGYTRTAPVGSFPPNGYGLYDMAGNVWEWTDAWYQPGHHIESSCCAPSNVGVATMEGSFDPGQPETPIPRKVLKGGSHLCTPQYCFRYRPAARQAQMLDTGMSHLGFRPIVRGLGGANLD